MKKKLTAMISAACAAVVLTGGSLFVHASYYTEPAISYERASEIAIETAGGGTIYEMGLDYEHGVLVYEIELRTDNMKYDMDINAATGEVVKNRTKSIYNPSHAVSNQVPQASQATVPQITSDRAIELAIEAVGGGTIGDMELDREHGVLVYEMEVYYNYAEYDVEIDATSGEVLKCRWDD